MSVFFGGTFFGGGFFQNLPTGQVAEVVRTGGKGDNDRKRRIYKPTGLPPEGRKTVEQRVQETREVHREVLKLKAPPKQIQEMSLAEIDAEIGSRLREQLRKEDEEIILMLLAAVAG